MRTLLDAHFYSVLYYNAEIWVIPILCSDMRQQLLSISANAIRSCIGHEGFDFSFDDLHKIHKKCTQKQIMLYKMSLKLHKLLNEHDYDLTFEHVTLLDQIVCTRRQIKFQIYKNSKAKIGLNTTANKLFPSAI